MVIIYTMSCDHCTEYIFTYVLQSVLLKNERSLGCKILDSLLI